MADPLSITASIIALLQAAHSVVSLCKSYQMISKGSNGLLQELCAELESLSSALWQLQDLASKHDRREEIPCIVGLAAAGGPLEKCLRLIQNTEERLKFTLSSCGFKKARLIFTWPSVENDIQSSLHTIVRHKLQMLLALEQDNVNVSLDISSSIKQSERRLDAALKSERYEKIIKWLDPDLPARQHARVCKKRSQGTGEWLYQDDGFKEWQAQGAPIMWLRGDPGCGKSVLCSTLIESIRQHREPNTTLVYYYFDFSEASKDDSVNMLRAIVGQLCQQEEAIPAAVEKLYDGSCSLNHSLGVGDFKEVLEALFCPYEQTYLVLDALDECADRDVLLETIAALMHLDYKRLRIVAFSRRETDIEDCFKSLKTLHVELKDTVMSDDIAMLIKNRLTNEFQFKRLMPAMKKHIETTLVENARGMFILADRQLDALKECRSPAQVKRSLSMLPRNVTEMYERILNRIQNSGGSLGQAIAALKWLTVAARPLHVDELAEAVAVIPGSSAIDKDNRLFDPKEEQLLSLCPGLITIYPDGSRRNRVRLAHMSVKEYLMGLDEHGKSSSGFGFREHEAHKFITEICLTYLLIQNREDSLTVPLPDSDEEELQQSAGVQSKPNSLVDFRAKGKLTPKAIYAHLPLLRYSAKYIIKHIKNLREDDLTQFHPRLMSLFDPSRDASFLNWIRAHNPGDPGWYKYNFDLRLQETRPPLYYASTLGLETIVQALIENGADVYAKSLPETSNGSKTNESAVITDTIGSGSIERISEGDDILLSQWKSPLHRAIIEGHESVVQLLLSHGFNVHYPNENGETPVRVAINHSRQNIINLLIARGAVLEDELQKGAEPPLVRAAINGDEKMVRFLLERGADVNFQIGRSDTALYEAAFRGHEKVIDVLLEHGADVHKGYHSTVLDAAVGDFPSESIIQKLLRAGADPNLQFLSSDPHYHAGKSGLPIHGACIEESDVFMRLLLDHGADVNKVGGMQGSALHAAAWCGRSQRVHYLLGLGADATFSHVAWGSTIATSIRECDLGAISAILDAGADVNALAPVIRESAIQVAALIDDHEKVDLLLSRGALLNGVASGKWGFPLQAAAFFGHDAMITKLIDAGADVDGIGGRYGTALSAAAYTGKESTAQILLDRGACVQLNEVSRLARIGYRGPHIGIITLLKERGFYEECPEVGDEPLGRDHDSEINEGESDDDAYYDGESVDIFEP